MVKIENSQDCFVQLWRKLERTRRLLGGQCKRFCIRNVMKSWFGFEATDDCIWKVCHMAVVDGEPQEGWDELPSPSLYPRKHREFLRAIVAVRTGKSFFKINLRALDSAYSIAFPHSTPINVNKKKVNMEKVEMNKDMKLSEHFTLGELCKTSHKTADGNIPSRVVIENLRNLCENWLEDLRYSYNTPLIINSGYRSPEVNKLAGGAPTSNHLTGCAVDIHVSGFEQAVRYAAILLDISESTKRDYDELFIERNKDGRYWIHFAVRLTNNRRKIGYLKG